MSLRGNVSSLKKFAESLRVLPKRAALRVAEMAAPMITSAAQDTYAKSQTPYGVGWDPGAEGQIVTLRKSGRMASFMRYVAAGTVLRVALGVDYAKYQVGKRPVFPVQGGQLPKAYTDALGDASRIVIREELAQ